MNFLKLAVSICIIILGLAGCTAGLLLLDKPSDIIPFIGIFLVVFSIAIPIWLIKLIYRRKHEKQATGPIPIRNTPDDDSVRRPN
jgi:hypothetical protein